MEKKSFCTECGSKIEKSQKYCVECGKNVLSVNKSNFSLKELKKLYLITGNVSMFFGIFSIITGMFFGFEYKNIITDLFVVLVLNFPRLYFGFKLRNIDLDNLQYPLKISLGMFIYTLIFTLLNIFTGTGWLYLLLVYYYFKSYRETKKILRNKNEVLL